MTAVSAILLCSCTPTGVEKTDAQIKVTFLDVGQGDASLLEFPSGRIMLVDAGSQNSGIDTLLKNRGITTIHDLVITHPDEDHSGNARTVVNGFTVSRVLFNRSDYSSEATPLFRKLFHYIVDTLNLDTLIPVRGRVLPEYTHTAVTCLWPEALLFHDATSNTNSIVLKITIGQGAILLTGDIDFEAEKRVLRDNRIHNIDILKVAHHGSKYSSSTAFLTAVRPRVSIISAGGNNPYGHPDQAVLQRLTRTGSRIFRTDMAGSVVVWLNEGGDLFTK